MYGEPNSIKYSVIVQTSYYLHSGTPPREQTMQYPECVAGEIDPRKLLRATALKAEPVSDKEALFVYLNIRKRPYERCCAKRMHVALYNIATAAALYIRINEEPGCI